MLTIPTVDKTYAPLTPREAFERAMRTANVPEDLWRKTFLDEGPDSEPLILPDPDTIPDEMPDTANLRWIVDHIKWLHLSQTGAQLSGPTRQGKTHIAAAYVRQTLGVRDAYWINEYDLYSSIRATFNDKALPGMHDLLRYLDGTGQGIPGRTGRIKTFVLDDLGTAAAGSVTPAWWIAEMTQLIDFLRAKQIRLIVTTNVPMKTLSLEPEEGGYGARLGERIKELVGKPLLVRRETPPIAFPGNRGAKIAAAV